MEAFFQFVLEHKYFYDTDLDETSFTRMSLENSLIIFIKKNESKCWMSKKPRWVTVVNIIDPTLTEAKLIIYKAIHPWIYQVPKQNSEFSRLFATVRYS